jgi:hypothetical protein
LGAAFFFTAAFFLGAAFFFTAAFFLGAAFFFTAAFFLILTFLAGMEDSCENEARFYAR